MIRQDEMSLFSLPHVREFRTRKDALEAFKTLVNPPKWDLQEGPYQINSFGRAVPFFPLGKPVILRCAPEDYEEVNWLSDWHNHGARLAAKRFDEAKSPKEAWPSLADDLPLNVLQDRRKAEAALYQKVRGCGNFRPLVYRFLIDYFGAVRVLDPCAGWGCRLLAAMAAGVEYWGSDCNPDVHPGYVEAIGEWYRPYYPRPNLFEGRFQDHQVPAGYFDLVATSPPYWDLEAYPGSGDLGTEQEWIDDFLKPLFRHAWRALRKGGVLVLIINGKPRKPKEEPSKYIAELHLLAREVGFAFDGVIAYADFSKGTEKPRSPQPMWVFRKPQGTEPPVYPVPIPWVTFAGVPKNPGIHILEAMCDKAFTSEEAFERPSRVRVTAASDKYIHQAPLGAEATCLIVRRRT